MSKRDLFSELTTALVDAKAHSQGKLTLGAHSVNDIDDLAISPDEIVNIRETFNMSRGVFAYIIKNARKLGTRTQRI